MHTLYLIAIVAEAMSGALMGMRRGMDRFGLALVGTRARGAEHAAVARNVLGLAVEQGLGPGRLAALGAGVGRVLLARRRGRGRTPLAVLLHGVKVLDRLAR